ncbi:MAG: hypothetical protein HY342_13035 [Candidatus Lambdaproteobacteria bacterium]|nr:hypothetical protein [Candidatus Lambdaproteobacteria bacterium]
MVNDTVSKVGIKLERLTRRDFSIAAALELMAQRARTVEEQVVIEVMREVYRDMNPEAAAHAQDFSRSRSA